MVIFKYAESGQKPKRITFVRRLPAYCVLFLIIFQFAIVQAKTYYDNITDFEIVKVRDGDTFVINIENVPDVFGKENSRADTRN